MSYFGILYSVLPELRTITQLAAISKVIDTAVDKQYPHDDPFLPAILHVTYRVNMPIPLHQVNFLTNMPANLPQLSIEIVQLLASNLDCQEPFSLRLVCRDLYKSLRTFAKLFDLLKTDLTAQSLQKLSNISESAHLAPHVKNLRFRGDRKALWGGDSNGIATLQGA